MKAAPIRQRERSFGRLRRLGIEPLEERRLLDAASGADITLDPAAAGIIAQDFISFADISAGLNFTSKGDFLGAAWFDYDRDGLQDLFVNNAAEGGREVGLYHNVGNGNFVNETVSAGLVGFSGLSGVVTGDLDNDGFEDIILTGAADKIFLSNNDAVHVLRNQGDGTFADVKVAADFTGLQTPGSAALADVDGDGLLDLFITGIGSLVDQDQPPSTFYRNLGNFRFEDVTFDSGVDAALGACVTGFSDYDGDGDVDLFVGNCNDIAIVPTPMQLFRNEGDFQFTDVSVESGLMDQMGFWMGIAFADYDNDGDVDVFATNVGTNVEDGPHGLFENNGDGTFSNVASDVGVGEGEFGWGTAFQDFDNDGFADIAFAGTLGFNFGFVGPGIGNPGRMFANELGEQAPSNTFADVSGNLNIDLSDTKTSGLARGDFNNDGFADLVIMAENVADGESATVLLLNSGNDNHWLGIDLEGTLSNRDAVGAWVTVTTNNLTLTQEIYAGSSFLSSDSKSLRFGLGEDVAINLVQVRWPSGLEEQFLDVGEVDQIFTLVEGTGVAVPEPSTLALAAFGVAALAAWGWRRRKR